MAEIPADLSENTTPVTILQAHMDMVVAVSDTSLGSNPVIIPVRRSGVLQSDGRTSLGADNGIGVAVILTLVCRHDFPHGPLRVLFTISEEIGLKGAGEIPPRWLAGASYLINTDGFHADTELIGCKGGCRETFSRKMCTEPVIPSYTAFHIGLSGFTGGHSGDDIDKSLCNAVQALACILSAADIPEMRIGSFRGGVGFNVIPARSDAVVFAPIEKSAPFTQLLREVGGRVLSEYQDRGTLSIKRCVSPDRWWQASFQKEVLQFLTQLENGVCERIPETGAVSSSCNLGRVLLRENMLLAQVMFRCDKRRQEQRMLARHSALAECCGFESRMSGYHSWHTAPDSTLSETVCQAYEKLTGVPILRKTAKVGLETALFQEKAPEIQMVCLGADIQHAHSVNECVREGSAVLLFRLIQKTLTALENGGKPVGTPGRF
ncbi:MAG: aminoacyl-histidine dipeptidase [Clostridiales bacterium]|nr:aminoacyl-histidine dipeptidase [Clostridiales bacterium]